MPRHTAVTPTFGVTILHAREGKRLAKLYRDPSKPPLDYDAGNAFRAEEVRCRTFAEFVDTLASLGPDQCIIRGRVREEARPVVEAGHHVARRAYDNSDDGIKAAFEPCRRRWLVLDVDTTGTPLDADDYPGSVRRFMRSLPRELRRAQKAMFLSAQAHRSKTVRGKLVVALAKPLGNAAAEAYAKSLGFDPCVLRTVQPNFFARPIFEGCEDPIAEYRAPFVFEGAPAVLPRIDTPKVDDREQNLGERERTPDDVPPLSKRARKLLTPELRAHWLEGERMADNAALHLFGWLLGKGWRKAEVASLLAELDREEPSREARHDHKRALNNARALEGPGAAKEWLGKHFAKFDRTLHRDPTVQGFLKLAASSENARMRPANEPDEDDAASDPWENPGSFTAPERPIEYACEGLCLAPSRGKVSVIAGNGNGGKGPIAIHLAVCFALGLPAFGAHQCETLTVLHLDCEGEHLTMRRMRRMCRALGHEPAELEGRIRHIDTSCLGDLTSETQQERLAQQVDKYRIGCVILDSYTTAMLSSGIEHNSPQYAVLAQLLGRLGLLVIVVAHSNKANARNGKPHLTDISGTGALGALMQTAIMVHYPDEDDKNTVRVSCGRAPEGDFAPFDVHFEDRDNGESLSVERVVEANNGDRNVPGKRESAAAVRAMAAAAKHADRVVDLLERSDRMRQGMTARKIRGALAISGGSWGDVRAELLRREAVEEYTLPSDSSVVVRLARRRKQRTEDE